MTTTATWKAGQAVQVVEHDDGTRQRKPGGLVFGAEVTGAEGIYVSVRYTEPSPTRVLQAHDQFYAESGWRAWDGQFRWRLVNPESSDE